MPRSPGCPEVSVRHEEAQCTSEQTHTSQIRFNLTFRILGVQVNFPPADNKEAALLMLKAQTAAVKDAIQEMEQARARAHARARARAHD